MSSDFTSSTSSSSAPQTLPPSSHTHTLRLPLSRPTRSFHPIQYQTGRPASRPNTACELIPEIPFSSKEKGTFKAPASDSPFSFQEKGAFKAPASDSPFSFQEKGAGGMSSDFTSSTSSSSAPQTLRPSSHTHTPSLPRVRPTRSFHPIQYQTGPPASRPNTACELIP